MQSNSCEATYLEGTAKAGLLGVFDDSHDTSSNDRLECGLSEGRERQEGGEGGEACASRSEALAGPNKRPLLIRSASATCEPRVTLNPQHCHLRATQQRYLFHQSRLPSHECDIFPAVALMRALQMYRVSVSDSKVRVNSECAPFGARLQLRLLCGSSGCSWVRTLRHCHSSLHRTQAPPFDRGVEAYAQDE